MKHKEANPFTDLCKKCRHRKRCKAPCAPVEKYLAHGTSKTFEIWLRDAVTVLCPESKRVVRASEMEAYQAARAFSTTNQVEHPLDDLNPKLKQTGVFIDRFFNRLPFPEIAKKYRISQNSATALYGNAVKRLLKTVEAMDRVELAKANGKRLAELPTRDRVKILYFGLEMPVVEIARFIGISHSAVIKHVGKLSEKAEVMQS